MIKIAMIIELAQQILDHYGVGREMSVNTNLSEITVVTTCGTYLIIDGGTDLALARERQKQIIDVNDHKK
jgi:hypothetical protein